MSSPSRKFRRPSGLASAAVVLAAAVGLTATRGLTATGASAQPAQVFRGGTDLVEVDVVVHGSNGAFVPDLSIGDFTIEERGQPQEIQQFYLHVTGAPGTSPPAGRNTSPAISGAGSAAQSGGRMFVVIFDDAHLSPGGFKRTQAAAQTLISTWFQPGDIGGVVIDGRVTNGRLTSDREELLATVRSAKLRLSARSRIFDAQEWPRLTEVEAVRIIVNNDATILSEAIARACVDDPTPKCSSYAPSAVHAKAQNMAADSRQESARTLQTIANALNGLARFEGPKTILLMSEGFMAEETWPLVQDAVGLAARANARIYTLDARGLDRPLRTVADVSPSGVDTSARMLAQVDFGSDSTNSLAVDTGGFVVRNTNQFDKAIARIGDDVSNYYILGFRPTTPQDGTFHKIEVHVKGRSLAVRARRGYVAVPRTLQTPSNLENLANPTNLENPANPTNLENPANPSNLENPANLANPANPAPAVSQPANGIRARGGGEANAFRLAPTAETDPDATEGWAAYERGDAESARTRLSVAAARPTAHVWVHYTLGLASYALGRYREAADAWERVRAGAADFEPVCFDLIDAYLQLKEHDRAIRTARSALAHWPKDAELYQALGVVQTIRGSLDDAVKSFQSAAALSPDDAKVYFNLGKAMELRYYRSRRYVNQMQRWVSNEHDRSGAIENYQRYLELGGAYADSAREGLTRLQWVPPAPK